MNCISIAAEIFKGITINGTDIKSDVGVDRVCLHVGKEDGTYLRPFFSCSFPSFKELYRNIKMVHNLEQPMYTHPIADHYDGNGFASFVEGLNGVINIIVYKSGIDSNEIYQVDGDKFLESIQTILEAIENS